MNSGDNLRSRYRTRQQATAPVSAQARQSSHAVSTERQQTRGQLSENPGSSYQQNRTTVTGWAKSQPKRIKVILAIAMAVAAVGITGALYQFDREDGPQSLGVVSDEINVRDVRPVEELSFAPLYPEDFEDRGIVFAQRQRGDTDYVSYTDVLDGVAFTVTQQRATEEISGGDLAQLENLGRSLPVPAEQYFRANDTPVFIGTDNDGSQSAVFVKEEVLVFVYAEAEIREFVWATYIDSLIQ